MEDFLCKFLRKLLPHKATRTTPAEFQEIYARLDAKMCGLTKEWAFEEMDVGDFLTLLNIAENEKLGKTKAILYAFLIGYTAGKEDTQNGQ